MKKVVLIIFMSAICLGSFAQRPIHERLKRPDLNERLSSITASTCPADSSQAYWWSSTTSNWDLAYKQIYTYNNYNFLSTLVQQNWNKTSNAFENSRQTFSTYDLNNNVTSYYGQDWSSTDKQWITTQIITSVYDEKNNVTLSTEQLMNNSVLLNNNKRTWAYNSNNLITNKLLQLWDITSNEWVNYERTINAYGATGLLSNYTIQRWNKSTDTWIDYTRSAVTYNANGDRDIISQTWSVADNAWKNSTYYGHFIEETITVADGKILKQTNQNWNANNNTWVDYTVSTWNYDIGNKLTEFKIENWNDVKGLWEGDFQYLYFYDTDNNMVLVIENKWDTQNSSWVDLGKFENYYNCTITEVAQKEKNESIQVSPNPSKGQLNFKGLNGENTIIIYDLQGSQVHQSFTKDKTASIKLTGEKSGIYFYRAINNKNQVRTGKLIIE